MRCVKQVRWHPKTNGHGLSKKKVLFYSETVFKVFDRESKNIIGKKPDKHLKKYNQKRRAKTRRHNRTFVQGPHVGMGIVGADILHGWQAVRVTE